MDNFSISFSINDVSIIKLIKGVIVIKPIFVEEKAFFEKRTGITLPDNCWRDGSKIYLNCDSKKPLITFRVENKKINLIKNIINKINSKTVNIKYKKGKKIIQEEWINYTLEEEYQIHKDNIEYKERESVDEAYWYILNHKDAEVRASDSGGKDSTLSLIMLDKVYSRLRKHGEKIDDYIVDFNNTTNETAQTYLQIKENNKNKNLEIHNPQKGFYQWIEEDKNYYLPSIMVRNCCSTYKEGTIKKVLDKNKSYVLVLGMRKYESSKRADYDWDLNESVKSKGKMKLNVPEAWHRFLIAVEWKDEEVWLYLLHNNINFNIMYRYGFDRVGCLFCPYSKDYTDLIIEEYYPKMYERWMNIIDKNYEIYKIGDRLKWTKEEWRNGKWKQGTSKEYYIIQNRSTKERIRELAEIKGISEELAAKYFNKKCSCGRKLNPDEIAMFLKRNGRYEGIEDNRQYLCKNCMCKHEGWSKNKYKEELIKYVDQGCNLF